MRPKRTARTKPATTNWNVWPTLCALLIVAGALAAYFNSFKGAFLFDEDRRIVHNERLHHLWPPWHLLRVHRPVVEVSLAVNYAMGGADVGGYHAFNLAVHIAAGLTLFGIVRRTLLLEALRVRYGRASPWIALAVALLWVVHPLQTQSVTYIIQRGESLMGMFYLLMLYCVIRGTGSSRRLWWYLAAIGCSVLGMGSKAVMATGPVVVLLYDRTFLAGSFRETLRRRWHLYAGLGATWLALFATGIAQGVLDATPSAGTHVGFGFAGVTPLEYLRSQPGVIARYLRLSLWPNGLCLDYYWPVARTTEAVLGPLMLIAPLLIATLWALYKKPRLGFIGAWFFIILLPTSSFVPIKDLAFEHRVYLPLVSVIVLVVVGGHALLTHAVERRVCSDMAARALGVTVLVGVAGGLAYATAMRNRDYHSELAMWSDVVAKRPNNPRAHDNLAIAWEELGRLDRAEQSLREAIRVRPDYPSAYSNLGGILGRQGRYDEAIDLYHHALGIDPDYVFARVKLGDALVRRGRIDEGIGELRAAVRLSPRYPVARYVLGNALSARGDLDGAIEQYHTAMRFRPDYAEAYYSLGNALRDQDNPHAAIEQYRRALRINSRLVSAHNNLGHVLLRLDRFEEASARFREALRLNPRHPGARYGLSDALAGQGRRGPPRKD